MSRGPYTPLQGPLIPEKGVPSWQWKSGPLPDELKEEDARLRVEYDAKSLELYKYYAPLAALWATLSGTRDEKLAQVNALEVVGPPTRNIPVSLLAGYCELSFWNSTSNPGEFIFDRLQVLAKADNAISPIASKAIRVMSNASPITSLVTSDPAHYAVIAAMLGALVSDGMDAANVDNILGNSKTNNPGMARETKLWWEANGYPSPFSEGDLDAATEEGLQ